MIYAVLDSNVLISGAGWHGSVPARVLDAAVSGGLILVTSDALLDEVLRAVRYPKLRRFFPRPRRLIDDLRAVSIVVTIERRISIVVADPADHRVLEAAIAGRADVIVSGDSHLLALHPFEDIPIFTPRDALALLE